MGLALLYTPLEADPPRPHAVDLVLIHGLNGDATRSWTNAATAAFWPGEFLPVDVPEARIFNFGYNADAVFGNTTADIVDHAKDLLSSLIDEREGERKSQPIIFIAHSLGGIIVKQALLSAKTELRYQSIQQNTLGIIFFGTPHRGSDKAKYGKVLAGVANTMTNKPSSKLVKALKENSDTLAQLTTAFRRELSQYQIVSFYEMKPPGFLRTLIVSKESALLNIDEEDQVPIDRSHRDLCKFAKRNDATYGKLVKRIRRILNQKPPGSRQRDGPNLSFYIPFPSNPHFVGREDLLEKLQEKLFSSNSVHNVAIFGLGGIGKTQLALRLIYWVKENRPNHSIFWVSALSYATFEQAYAEIFKKVGLQQFDKEDPKETLCDYLSSEKAGQWLLVIDNADDEDLLLLSTKQQRSISDYLPSSDNGRILYTTRTKRIATSVAGGNSMKLPEMTENEAKGFLTSLVYHEDQLNDEAAINDLLQELIYLPLAIKQASAYINENGINITEYLQLFRHQDQRNKQELISSNFHDRTRYTHENAISITWQISFDQISKKDTAAVRLLTFITCIEPKAIPRSMLPRGGASEQQLLKAIGTLCGYSFLSKRDDDVYDMHSLVYAATELWTQKQDITQDTSISAIEHFADIFPTGDWENREIWRQYLPHALKALQCGKGRSDRAGDLHFWIGRCLMQDGRYREAVSQLKQAVAIERQPLAEDHPSRLASQHELGRAYLRNGQIGDAIQLLKQVVAIKQQTLTEDHPSRLTSQHELGRAYLQNGQIGDAIQLLEKVVAIKQQTLAEDHPSRLASQHELGRAYLQNGQIGDAIQLLEKGVAIERQTLAEGHPDRLTSQHELSRAYLQNGQIGDAIQLLKKVVAIRQTLAENHPDRLASQHDLGRASLQSGQVGS